MIIAPTISSIIDQLDSAFERKTVSMPLPVIETDCNLFRPGNKLSRPSTETVKVRLDEMKLVGLLFMHPSSAIAKNDILPRINHYHIRSKERADFFLAGYDEIAQGSTEGDPSETTTHVAGADWRFCDQSFNDFLTEIESTTRWKYSGATDLVLLPASLDENDSVVLDFSQCIACNLEQIVRDRAFPDVPTFLETLFRFANESDMPSPYRFSDLHLLKKSGVSFLNWILGRLGSHL